MNSKASLNIENSIAIIGMDGRFPGAKNINEFWDNLKNGRESITHLSDDQLIAIKIDKTIIDDPNYVKAGAFLEDIDLFDANFFGYNPKEASAIDPQQRIFLECAYSALENAGYNPDNYAGKIGIFAGVGQNNYLLFNLNEDFFQTASGYQTLIGNEKDFLTTRISYLLNLKGISLDLQTACSTSLVATSMACQSLLTYQSDMALAGGISIASLKKTGYLYQEGGILSPDGHCRAFDAKAQGTVPGSGVGVVVLKRLEDAMADGDRIDAIIRGSAINNDGSGKIGYTAPSIEGQAEVVAEALALAEVEPETISYIETHGTGTTLGDPIEIAALNQVFRDNTVKKDYCALGSVKTNIGHLDAASGITGLIKTVLALKHQQIPPNLHFQQPNPKIDFANSPFYVNTQLQEWKTPGCPRRAGVSSFGIGGTNAHVVLEEAPVREMGRVRDEETKIKSNLLVLSAKSESALETATDNLVEHLNSHPELDLADVAYTLQVGRREFNYRRTVVGKDLEDVAITLQTRDPQRVLTYCTQQQHQQSIVFMFPGQGSQYVDMGKELYETEPVFREWIDRCSELLKSELELDLRSLLYPEDLELNTATDKLKQTQIAQPAIFTIEYALGQLWISWGIKPEAAIGHSIGEYVAATIAGVMSLEDALHLVALRGRMMQQMPTGSMLAVSLPEAEVTALLNEELFLAAVNAPSLCVISGTDEAIKRIQVQLSDQEIECRRLHTSHAFHSAMMNPVVELFQKEVTKISLNTPQIPFISNLTGTWITAAEATNPNYWAKHLRQTVRFEDGISQLLQDSDLLLLEVGAGKTLSTLVKRNANQASEPIVLSSLPHPKETVSDRGYILNMLGRLWLAGIEIDWDNFSAHEQRHRIPLPTYPFKRQRYWIEPRKPSSETITAQTPPTLWQSLVKAARSQSSLEVSRFDEQTYQENKQNLESLCIAYMNLTLKRLGAFNNPAERHSSEDLVKDCQVIPRYQQLFSRWLEILQEKGQLQQDRGFFTNFSPISTDYVDCLLAEVKSKWTDSPQEIELIQNCGEHLPAVLLGEKEPLELHTATLAAEGEISRQNSTVDLYYNAILRRGVEDLVKLLPGNIKLRILEIGGGTGIATAELLTVLPTQQTEYTFTDVGNLFLTEAKKKFSGYSNLKYGLLDIGKSSAEQGYSSHSFDVIVAVNVLHVPQNTKKALENLYSLLAPGGFLLIQEITHPQLNFDITDGLLMNPLEDEYRSQGNPFLSRQQWQEELKNVGFAEIEVVSEIESFGQHIIMAQTSSSPNGKATAFSTIVENRNISNGSNENSDRKLDIADWFYLPSWKRSIQTKVLQSQASSWLVFVDEYGLSDQIVKKLELKSKNLITVKIGKEFSSDKIDSYSFTLNPDCPEDYHHLLQELRSINFIPDKIVHAWNIAPVEDTELKEEETVETFKKAQKRGFYSLLFLVQAWSNYQLDQQLEIIAISNNMQAVTGEEILCPEKSTLLGTVKVIPQEYKNISCRSIDIVLPPSKSWQEKQLIDNLAIELTNQTSESIIAYRGLKRWIQNFEPVCLETTTEKTTRLKQGGVYLIVGGLGSLGLIIAKHLAQTCQAKLILTGRSQIPHRNEWSQWLERHDERDEINQKIRQLSEIEALGSEVLTFSADTANLEQMTQMLDQAETQFGQINGVIHCVATGLTETMRPIQNTNEIECEQQFQGKVYGLLALEKLLEHKNLDFCFLISSLASVSGGVGHAAYSASNLFMDTYVSQHNQINSNSWVSVNWDGRVSSVTQENDSMSLFKMRPELTMTSKDDVTVFEAILSHPEKLDRVIISTRNLLARISRWTGNQLADNKQNNSTIVNLLSFHSRPKLTTTYVAPGNQIEKTIVSIWQQILGIDQIGIHDNFFELGGDSLSGVTFINQFRKQIGQNIAVALMFEMPTIAELANHLSQKNPEVVLANGKNDRLIGEREEGVI